MRCWGSNPGQPLARCKVCLGPNGGWLMRQQHSRNQRPPKNQAPKTGLMAHPKPGSPQIIFHAYQVYIPLVCSLSCPRQLKILLSLSQGVALLQPPLKFVGSAREYNPINSYFYFFTSLVSVPLSVLGEVRDLPQGKRSTYCTMRMKSNRIFLKVQ